MRLVLGLLGLALLPSVAHAQINSGSDGLSGALNITSNTVIDLGLATTGTVTGAGRVNGTYDPAQWVVLFEYTSVNVSAGATVTFINHPSGAPVAWLVSGSVTIAGTVDLNGAGGTGAQGQLAEPGPGGFRGGRAWLSSGSLGSGGLGPGGGIYIGTAAQSGNGSYATAGGGLRAGPTYGNSGILPLIGGSGGAANGQANMGAGAGGGAILIVANNTITVSGTLRANGGSGNTSVGSIPDGGNGSGGGLRLVANLVNGAGTLGAAGGSTDAGVAGFGRIRLEANTVAFAGASNPNFTFKTPLDASDPVLWPASTAPTVRVTTLNGVAVPPDPNADMISPPGDVSLTAASSVPLLLEAVNVPSNATVTVRVVFKSGQDYAVPATFVSGTTALSTWSATLTALPDAGFAAIQATAVLP